MGSVDEEMTAWVLDGLYEVPWRALCSARPGANASAVPDLITALVTKAKTLEDFWRLRRMLEDEVIYEGFFIQAAPYVIPFLARWMLVDESEDARATAIGIIDLISADDPDDPDDSGTPEEREILRLALVDALDAVYDVIARASGPSRRQAITLAYGIDGMTPRLVEALSVAETLTEDEALREVIAYVRRDGRGGHLGRPVD